MTRREVFDTIEAERGYQDRKWGSEFDSKNTPNDWVAYISKYLGQSVTMPYDDDRFRNQLIKVATLAVAALEQASYAPRHYDKTERLG